MPTPRDACWCKPGDVIEWRRDQYKTIERTDTHYPVNGDPFTAMWFTDGTGQTYRAHETIYVRRRT